GAGRGSSLSHHRGSIQWRAGAVGITRAKPRSDVEALVSRARPAIAHGRSSAYRLTMPVRGVRSSFSHLATASLSISRIGYPRVAIVLRAPTLSSDVVTI